MGGLLATHPAHTRKTALQTQAPASAPHCAQLPDGTAARSETQRAVFAAAENTPSPEPSQQPSTQPFV